MNRKDDKIFEYARITIQADSPVSIAGGFSELKDMGVVRDANGLPAIPGTSIAGVLRSLMRAKKSDKVDALFGQIEDDSTRMSSRLEISWASVHDSSNNPCRSWISPKIIEQDSILKYMVEEEANNFTRDHVKINNRGTAMDKGKFDRTFVPRGARFSFNISMFHNGSLAEDFKFILELIKSNEFRLGGATRAGYGRFRVKEIKKGSFDLSNDSMLKVLKTRDSYLQEINVEKNNSSEIKINLLMPQGFRIGGGDVSFDESNSRQTDMLPYSEKVVVWFKDRNKKAEMHNRVVIPGSSLKGPLRHRTAFHLARLQGNWADEQTVLNESDGLEELFGYARDSEGKAGKLFFNDTWIDKNTFKAFVHTRNSIDRFTGGVADHALFSGERLILKNSGNPVCFEISVGNLDGVNEIIKKAFSWALDDLEKGRLAIGANSSGGLGFSSFGTVTGKECLK